MSKADLKEVVDRSSIEDRMFLQAYLDHLARVADPENGRDLDRRLKEMDAGKKVSLEDAVKLHEELKTIGL